MTHMGSVLAVLLYIVSITNLVQERPSLMRDVIKRFPELKCTPYTVKDEDGIEVEEDIYPFIVSPKKRFIISLEDPPKYEDSQSYEGLSTKNDSRDFKRTHSSKSDEFKRKNEGENNDKESDRNAKADGEQHAEGDEKEDDKNAKAESEGKEAKPDDPDPSAGPKLNPYMMGLGVLVGAVAAAAAAAAVAPVSLGAVVAAAAATTATAGMFPSKPDSSVCPCVCHPRAIWCRYKVDGCCRMKS